MKVPGATTIAESFVSDENSKGGSVALEA